jgi:hypothetical protein
MIPSPSVPLNAQPDGFLISPGQICGLGHNSNLEEVEMKKLLVVLPLAILLVALTISWAGAGMDYEDPKLCVEGKWLLVNAAHPAGIKVFLPEDTRYGDATQGGCNTPGPEAPMITKVEERGNGHLMRVVVDGAQATRPLVKVSYGAPTETRFNNGRGTLNFLFFVK